MLQTLKFTFNISLEYAIYDNFLFLKMLLDFYLHVTFIQLFLIVFHCLLNFYDAVLYFLKLVLYSCFHPVPTNSKIFTLWGLTACYSCWLCRWYLSPSLGELLFVDTYIQNLCRCSTDLLSSKLVSASALTQLLLPWNTSASLQVLVKF